jgi:hypothetical protein
MTGRPFQARFPQAARRSCTSAVPTAAEERANLFRRWRGFGVFHYFTVGVIYMFFRIFENRIGFTCRCVGKW